MKSALAPGAQRLMSGTKDRTLGAGGWGDLASRASSSAAGLGHRPCMKTQGLKRLQTLGGISCFPVN